MISNSIFLKTDFITIEKIAKMIFLEKDRKNTFFAVTNGSLFMYRLSSHGQK